MNLLSFNEPDVGPKAIKKNLINATYIQCRNRGGGGGGRAKGANASGPPYKKGPLIYQNRF